MRAFKSNILCVFSTKHITKNTDLKYRDLHISLFSGPTNLTSFFFRDDLKRGRGRSASCGFAETTATSARGESYQNTAVQFLDAEQIESGTGGKQTEIVGNCQQFAGVMKSSCFDALYLGELSNFWTAHDSHDSRVRRSCSPSQRPRRVFRSMARFVFFVLFWA